MLHSTAGIVLRVVPYSETSQVVTVYTSLFGLQAYMQNGVRKRGKNKSQVQVHPLMLLDMEVYHKPGARLNRIREFRPHPLLTRLFESEERIHTAQFLTELFQKTMREESPDTILFATAWQAVMDLEEGSLNLRRLPRFLLQYARVLGFEIRLNRGDGWLNLETGVLDSVREPGGFYASARTSAALFEEETAFDPGILSDLIRFYQLHLQSFGNMRSVEVLERLGGH